MPKSLFKQSFMAPTCNFIKNTTLAQVFSCEFCETSKKTFFNRTPLGDCFCKMTFTMITRFLFKKLIIWVQPNRCLDFFIVDSQKQPLEAFYKNGGLKNIAKFTGKHVCQSLFFNKVADLRPATLLKMRI